MQNQKSQTQKQQKPEEEIPQEEQMVEEKEQQVPFEEIKIQPIPAEEEFIEDDSEKANQHKSKGNQYYKSGDTENAIIQYQLALQYTPQDNHKMRSILYSNIGINLIKDKAYSKAIGYCKKALKHDEKYTKAKMNLARCYEEQDKIEEAYEEYKKLEEENPGDKFIQDKIRTLKMKVDEINEKRKEEVMSGLKNIGNSVLGYFGLSLDNFKMEQGEGGGYNIQFKN